ncbi:MAG: hypothetical protein IKD69_15195 [Solobacterium sp.]|nr:hypothetical protein [Solobacterium sp.]
MKYRGFLSQAGAFGCLNVIANHAEGLAVGGNECSLPQETLKKSAYCLHDEGSAGRYEHQVNEDRQYMKPDQDCRLFEMAGQKRDVYAESESACQRMETADICKSHSQEKDMRECTNDPFYEMIGSYGNCIVDYCILEDDTPHQGYRSHKDAVLSAMLKVIERDIDTRLKDEVSGWKVWDEPFPWSFDIVKAQAHQIDSDTLLYVPQMQRTDRVGRRVYDGGLPDPLQGGQIPYWYAFLETPHPSGYGPDDFRKVNSILFPKGTDGLEVYEWTTDWSSYFDEGHEWWGTACWSVYDRNMERYVVIMASATD